MRAEPGAEPDVEASAGPFSALSHPAYRLFWICSLISFIGNNMQQVANEWQIYLLTHDAFQLGLVGLTRAIPLIGLGLVGGAIADTIDRRVLVRITQSLQLVLAVVLGVLTQLDIIAPWHIYLVSVVNACILAFDNPARQAIIFSIVP